MNFAIGAAVYGWACLVFRVQDAVNGTDWMLHFLTVDVVDEFK